MPITIPLDPNETEALAVASQGSIPLFRRGFRSL